MNAHNSPNNPRTSLDKAFSNILNTLLPLRLYCPHTRVMPQGRFCRDGVWVASRVNQVCIDGGDFCYNSLVIPLCFEAPIAYVKPLTQFLKFFYNIRSIVDFTESWPLSLPLYYAVKLYPYVPEPSIEFLEDLFNKRILTQLGAHISTGVHCAYFYSMIEMHALEGKGKT